MEKIKAEKNTDDNSIDEELYNMSYSDGIENKSERKTF